MAFRDRLLVRPEGGLWTGGLELATTQNQSFTQDATLGALADPPVLRRISSPAVSGGPEDELRRLGAVSHRHLHGRRGREDSIFEATSVQSPVRGGPTLPKPHGRN